MTGMNGQPKAVHRTGIKSLVRHPYQVDVPQKRLPDAAFNGDRSAL
jgi:hypothetical protein